METARYIIVLITSDSIEETDHIARLLLEKKKVACVNICLLYTSPSPRDRS